MSLEEALYAHLVLQKAQQQMAEERRAAHWTASRPTRLLPAPLPETVHVVRHRMWGQRGWAAYRGEGVDGRRYFGMAEIRQSEGEQWDVVNGSWGIEQSTKGFREPSVNLGGWWAPEHCWGGGYVYGALVHRVRLVDADGKFDEDLVEHGITLLFIEGPYRNPCVVELYDAEGALLGTQSHAPPDWTGA